MIWSGGGRSGGVFEILANNLAHLYYILVPKGTSVSRIAKSLPFLKTSR